MKLIQIENLPSYDASEQNQINTICSNLLFGIRDKKSIVVTSCHDSEGKTYTTMRIALSLVKEGYKVALIDADLSSSPSYYKADSDIQTLTDYNSGGCKLSDIVYNTDVCNLYLIPHSDKVPLFAAPINTAMFSAMLEELKPNHDFILIDTPSAACSIDAAKIASVSDGIIFVVAYNSTKKKDLAETVEQLHKSGCPILGCIINKLKFNSIISRKRYRLMRTSFLKRVFKRKNGKNR